MPTETWRKEPPGQRPRWGQYDWEAITAKLRKKPGEWMLVDDQARLGLQSAITRKRMVALRSDEWDYLVSTSNTNMTDRTSELWMSAVRKDEPNGG